MQPPNSGPTIPRWVRILIEYKFQVINVFISAVFVTVSGYFISLDGTWGSLEIRAWGFILLVLSAIVSIFLTVKASLSDSDKQRIISKLEVDYTLTSYKVKELEGENEKLRGDYEQLVFDQLSLIYYKMGLSKTERISVYKHDNENKHFVLIGRYARNPAFTDKSRSVYPDSEGFIMKGWQDGELVCKDLPDPVKFDKYYNEVNKISKISKEVVNKIRMKSRCFYVRSIRTPTTQMPVAVVVVESLQPQGVAIEEIRKSFEEGEERRLYSFVEKMAINSVQSNVQNAQKAGL